MIGTYYFKKYGHYVPVAFFAAMDISLRSMRFSDKIDIPNWATAATSLCIGFSFAYALTKEAKKFQSKGKYGSVYRIMFGAGAICAMFIFEALRDLLGF
ncbi:MAG: hypothetical protein AB2L24_14365 [Mangrovibacterium sp.]